MQRFQLRGIWRRAAIFYLIWARLLVTVIGVLLALSSVLIYFFYDARLGAKLSVPTALILLQAAIMWFHPQIKAIVAETEDNLDPKQ